MKKSILQLTFVLAFINCEAQIQPVPVETVNPTSGAENKLGGYIGCLDLEPGTPNHILAAGGLSGLYESWDAGRTWGHINSLPAYRLVFVSFCPTDPNIILVTAGPDTRVNRPSGIWRSNNKGRTWTNLSLPPPVDISRCAENAGAYTISWVPNSDRVIIGTDCGIAISPDKGTTWSLVTVNPGARSANNLPDRVESVLAVDENNFVANTLTGLFWSSNGGAAWSLATGMPVGSTGSGHALCMTPTDRKILFYYNYGSLLQYSVDRGHTWSTLLGYDYGQNQPPFVKATLAGTADNHLFDLYVGDGRGLSRVRLDSRSAGRWSAVTPESLRLSHADPQDILFHPTTKKPFILSGDGGIQIPEQEDGASWINVGGGRDGLDGLEVKGIAVQTLSRRGVRQTDLYAATWHNNVMWSPDGGASWTLTDVTEASNVESNGPLVSESEARISMHAWDQWLRLYGRGYSGITTSFEPLFRQGVTGAYLRYFRKNGRQCMLASINSELYMVPVEGDTWKWLYQFAPSLTDRMLINAPSISYQTDGSVIVYQPYQRFTRDANNELERGLKKITIRGTIDAPTATVTSVAMRGFSNLGQMGEYWGKAIFASRPDNPQVLIAADVGEGRMKKSVSGGENWTPDDLLTNLVTDYGRLRFYTTFPEVVPQPQVIAFNPYNNQEVYVSTVESGIIYSRDGGTSWNRVSGSGKLNYVSSIGFTPDGMVYFGSRARGLWKYNSKSFVKYPFYFMHDTRVLLAHPLTGALVPIEDLGPEECPPCRVDLFAKGVVTDLQYSADGDTTVFVSDSNAVYSFIPETTPTEAITFKQKTKASPGVFPIIAEIEKSGRLVKGIVSEKGRVRAFVVGDKTLKNIPMELLFRNEMLTGLEMQNPEVEKNEAYRKYNPTIIMNGSTSPNAVWLKQYGEASISGTGFEPTSEGKNLVSVWMGTNQIDEKVVVDDKGTFSLMFKIPPVAGRQDVIVRQQTRRGMLKESIFADVANSD